MVAANIIVGLCSVLLGYILGSFPTGVFIGKVFYHKDPRDYGSHNSGGTNTGRVLGKKVGVLTIVIDALKAGVVVWIVWAILTFTGLKDYMVWNNGYYAAPAYYWGAGLAAAIGHCASIFLRFKGGKAVACEVGMNVTHSWLQFLVIAASFFLPLKIKKYVSLSSMIMSVCATISLWILAILRLTTTFNTQIFSWDFGTNAASGFSLPILGIEAAIVMTVLTVIIIVRHRGNIQRIKEGTEPKITWMK